MLLQMALFPSFLWLPDFRTQVSIKCDSVVDPHMLQEADHMKDWKMSWGEWVWYKTRRARLNTAWSSSQGSWLLGLALQHLREQQEEKWRVLSSPSLWEPRIHVKTKPWATPAHLCKWRGSRWGCHNWVALEALIVFLATRRGSIIVILSGEEEIGGCYMVGERFLWGDFPG